MKVQWQVTPSKRSTKARLRRHHNEAASTLIAKWDIPLVSSDRQDDQFPKGFLLLAVFDGVSLRAHQTKLTLSMACRPN
jgi:hypothetical protein